MRVVLAGTDTPHDDMLEAQRLALQARDDRRRWRGDSAEAVAAAYHAAMLAEDYRGAVALGRSDGGQATPEEAADPRVRAHVALALIALGRTDPAPDLTGLPTYEEARLQAMLDRSAGRDAEPAWRRAHEAAQDDSQRTMAVAGLAAAGAADLPGIEDLQKDHPDIAALVLATADLAAGRATAAQTRLRASAGDTPQTSMLLAQAQESIGRLDTAAETLQEASRRFSDPSLGSAAVRLLSRQGADTQAEALADTLLATTPRAWSGRADLLSYVAHRAALRGDDERAADLAAAAVAADLDDPGRRWTLMRMLLLSGNPERAAQALREHPTRLLPANSDHAQTWIAVLHEQGSRQEIDLAVADLARLYPDDEALLGRTVALATMPTSDDGTADATRDEAAAVAAQAVTQDYLQRFPAGTVRAFTVDEDADSESLLDQIGEHLRVDAETSRNRRQLHARIARQELPLGVYSSATRRSYASLVLGYGFGILPGTAPDPAEHVRCVADATSVLDGAAVLDTTALCTLASLPQETAGVLLAALARHEVLDETFADIRQARRDANLRSDISVVWDDVADRASVHQTSQHEIDRQRALAERLHRVARNGRRRAAAPGDQRLSEARYSPWWPTVHSAITWGRPLWADDSALRTLARSEGAAAFSTGGLLDALVNQGRLDMTAHREALRLLVLARTSAPFDAARLHELAREEGWAAGVAAVTMNTPAAWTDPVAAHRRFARVVPQGAKHRPEALADWLYIATCGAGYASSNNPDASARLGAVLLATALHDGHPAPALAARLLAASRAALVETAADPKAPGDPLTNAVGLLHTTYGEALPGIAAPYLLALFSDTDPADRSAVARAVLAPPNTSVGLRNALLLPNSRRQAVS
jgi:hypothetical protein